MTKDKDTQPEPVNKQSLGRMLRQGTLIPHGVAIDAIEGKVVDKGVEVRVIPDGYFSNWLPSKSGESFMEAVGFRRTLKEVRKSFEDRSMVLSRISLMVNRVAYCVGILDQNDMAHLGAEILKKFPKLPGKLIVDCFEVANPATLGLTQEGLEKLLENWKTLTAVIDPTYGAYRDPADGIFPKPKPE
jgi:hypothetical protein